MNKRQWRRFGSIVIIVAISLMFGFSFGVVYGQRPNILRQFSDQQSVFLGKVMGLYTDESSGKLVSDLDFRLFWQTWDLLKANYVDQEDLTDKQMFYGALRGLVGSIGDPYTVFMNPEDAKMFNEDLLGSFSGIGAEVGLRNEVVTVIAPLAGTPAEQAGLRPGDKVYAIDHESTLGLTLDEAVKKIRGPQGESVILTIARGQDSWRDIEVVRDLIVVKSVKTEYDQTSELYSIVIDNFNADTNSLVQEAVNDIIEKNPRGILLDLRNNPGGYLDSAVVIASHWINSGVIVSEQFSDQQPAPQLARGLGQLANWPTVVLINQGSASASEIVAGALRDHDRATIVGKTTFGKGSVQMVRDLPDGSMVKITTAKWLTPNGVSINDQGIVPDIEVDYTEEDFNNDLDPQLERAKEVLLEQVNGN